MRITGKTKISVLIKSNPASIDAIAAIAKPLEKLRNPLLRKIMASRVTIAEAAKLGGVGVTKFVEVLSPLGFEFESSGVSNEMETAERPGWLLDTKPQHIENFDVREILKKGEDPLGQIMRKYKSIEPQHILCIINSFAPTPLIAMLSSKGAEAYIEEVSPQEYHTYFMKPSKEVIADSAEGNDKVVMVDESEFREMIQQFGDKHVDIDVRNLEMPGPMQCILNALETLPDAHVLNVLHKRVPVYLLEALADKQYETFIYNKAEDDIHLLISKQAKNGRH